MKNKALKFLNPILLLMFLVTMVAMVLYKIGPGSETLGDIHQFAGILFAIVGLLHLYYNWGWVRSNILNKKKR